MDGPQLKNAAANFVNGLIQAILIGGKDAAEAYIATQDPELMAIEPIRWMVDEGLDLLVGAITTNFAKAASAAVIDSQTKGEASTAVTAAMALQFAEAGGKEDEIQSAIQTAAKAYAGVTNWDGVATIP